MIYINTKNKKMKRAEGFITAETRWKFGFLDGKLKLKNNKYLEINISTGRYDITVGGFVLMDNIMIESVFDLKNLYRMITHDELLQLHDDIK